MWVDAADIRCACVIMKTTTSAASSNAVTRSTLHVLTSGSRPAATRVPHAAPRRSTRAPFLQFPRSRTQTLLPRFMSKHRHQPSQPQPSTSPHNQAQRSSAPSLALLFPLLQAPDLTYCRSRHACVYIMPGQCQDPTTHSLQIQPRLLIVAHEPSCMLYIPSGHTGSSSGTWKRRRRGCCG